LPKEQDLRAKFPFTWESWRTDINANKWYSVFDNQFRLRPEVVYYKTPKLGLDSAESAYGQLSNTSFPTLYGALSPFEDFAESFVSYVHAVVDKRPWQIRLYRGTELKKTFELCWSEPRCEQKRKFMEQLLASR
jgi:hypothetical protein